MTKNYFSKLRNSMTPEAQLRSAEKSKVLAEAPVCQKCYVNIADVGSNTCVGCDAYNEHNQ